MTRDLCAMFHPNLLLIEEVDIMRKKTKRIITERMTQLLASKNALVAIEAAKLMLICEGLYPEQLHSTNIKASSKSKAQLNLAQAHVAKIMMQEKETIRIRNRKSYLKRKGLSSEEIERAIAGQENIPQQPENELLENMKLALGTLVNVTPEEERSYWMEPQKRGLGLNEWVIEYRKSQASLWKS
jgi:hypothetical protein